MTTEPGRALEDADPGVQADSGGFGSYRDFWGGIESASPSAIRANPRAKTVSYSVDYEKKDGSTQSDTVTLELVEQNGRYLIAGEQ